MNRIKLLLCALVLAITSTVGIAAEPPKKVLIIQTVQHSALDATTKGIIAGLANNGFKQGINLDLRVESAQASTALAAQIAAKYSAQHPDVVVGVGTLAAQSYAKYAQRDKQFLVFSSVTDPLGAGLVKSLNTPGNNTSGVSNLVELEPQLTLFKKIQPNLNTLGIIYNPGEINSVYIVNKLEKIAAGFGLKLIKQAVNKSADVAQAASKLVQQVDAIFISNDNTALSALQSIINLANKAKKPVYVSDTDAVKFGALAALGPNQYEIGLQTGAMLAEVLRGANLNTLPVEYPRKTDLYINLKTAEALQIQIPNDLLKQAVALEK